MLISDSPFLQFHCVVAVSVCSSILWAKQTNTLEEICLFTCTCYLDNFYTAVVFLLHIPQIKNKIYINIQNKILQKCTYVYQIKNNSFF